MSVTEDIKARLDIVNFISQYVPLKKAGRNYVAPCPFHAERTPSFVVFPESQGWRCFGACSEGGDIFNFLMKREGLDFASALRILADKAGVELHERSAEQVSRDEHLDKLRGLLEETARFFHNKLWEKAGDGARTYIRKRGLTDETLTLFKIGYAPDDWRQGLDNLIALGYKEDDIVETGVAIRNEKGRVYDRFRNRLMIPIRDARGLVIGFGARALAAEDNPKYLNSPQTPLFDKSATLFGFDMARRAIREGETAVIVEGYMDAIQAHQAGFTNVIAQMGTALTEPQLKQLSRYAKRLILALDPDLAGIKATMRGLEVARQSSDESEPVFDTTIAPNIKSPRISKFGDHTYVNPSHIAAMFRMMPQAGKLNVELLVISLPEGQDPDDLIRDNPDIWRHLVASAQPVANYVIAAAKAQLSPNATFSEREQIAHELLPILTATDNDLYQNYNIQRLSYELQLDYRALVEWTQQAKRALRAKLASNQKAESSKQLPQPKLSQSPIPSTESNQTVNQPGSVVEGYCLAMLIREPKLLYIANRKLAEIAREAPQAREALGPISSADLLRSDYRAIFSVLEHALAQDDEEPIQYLKRQLPYSLGAELDRLMIEPLDVLKLRLVPSMQAQLEAELEAAKKKKEGNGSTSAQTELEFVHKMLDLRRQRLKRDNQDLYFVIQDADPESEIKYNRRLKTNSSAIQLIDQAAKAMALLQREH